MHFMREEFSQIDDILPEDEEDEGIEGRESQNNDPTNLTPVEHNVITLDEGVTKTRGEDIEDSLAQ